jgi:hypothetical protein
MAKFSLFYFILITGHFSNCQIAPRQETFNLIPVIGAGWQGAITSNLIDFSHIIYAQNPAYCGGGPCMPYNYERNIQGLGFNAGLFLMINRTGLTFSPHIRYDEIYFEFKGSNRISHKEFIFNPRIGFNYYLFAGRKSLHKQYLGLFLAYHNSGKKFTFYDSVTKTSKIFYLNFPTLGLCYGQSIVSNKIFGEMQLYYLYRGLPHNHLHPFFMYGISLYYMIMKSSKRQE